MLHRCYPLVRPLTVGSAVVLSVFVGGLAGATGVPEFLWILVDLIGSVIAVLVIARVPSLAVPLMVLAAAFDNLVLTSQPLPIIGPLSISKVAAGVAFVAWALALNVRRVVLPSLRDLWNPLALLVLATTSWFWASDSALFLYRLQRVGLTTVGFCLAVSFLSDCVALKRLSSAIWLVGGLAAVVTLGESLPQFTLLSLDQSVFRASGGLGDPNELAMFEVMTLPFAIAASSNCGANQGRWPARVASVLIVLAVVSSMSRGGLAALGVVLIVTLVACWRERYTRWSVIAIALVVAGVVTLAPPLQDRFLEILGLSQSMPIDRRPTLWQVGITALIENPLTGVGLGNIVAPQVYFGIEDRLQGITMYGKPGVIHNGFLEIGAELGIVGLALYSLFFLGTTFRAIRATRVSSPPSSPALQPILRATATSLSGAGVALLFLSEQYFKLLWIMLALAVACSTMAEKAPSSPCVVHD